MKRRGLLTGVFFLLSTSARASEFQMQFGSARATVEIEGDSGPKFSDLVRRWLGRSAEALQFYYGRFPVPEVYIHIVVLEGAGVRGGQTFPGELPLIRMRMGKNSSEADLLQKDWVLVHEMVHLAFPWMNLRNNWMAEGLAVYVESIARVHAGHLTPARIWNDFAHMMPRGLPAPGDRGFDVTVSWGRTYWGGAIYCLLADVAIRQQTENRLGLQHALRAINAGRDFRREWDFIETLEVGDAATGTNVLIEQYQAMRHEAVSPDLDALWRELGIRVDSDAVELVDDAPLAAIRRAIETPAGA